MLGLDFTTGSRTVRVRCSERSDGDFAIDAPPAELDARRQRLAPYPWTWLRQEHGSRIVVVEEPGEHAGAGADAAVTTQPGAVLAVQSADCAAVAIIGDGAIGVAHAGWRGLRDGVIADTCTAVAQRSTGPVRAVVGPCISAAHYEFGADDLAALADRFGPAIRGTTAAGTPALDLRAGVHAALHETGVESIETLGDCTASTDRWFSHRARAETGRHTMAVWIEP